MFTPPEKLKFATKRTACPQCGSSDGFASVKGASGVGHCFACGWNNFSELKKMNGRFANRKLKTWKPDRQLKKNVSQFKSISIETIEPLLNPLKIVNSPFGQWALTLGIPPEYLAACGVGTTKDNSTVFVHRSPNGAEVWSVKIVRYGQNGKRDKTVLPYSPKGFQVSDGFTVPLYCPLKFDPKKPTYLVESEKTAVVCSFHLSAYNWLACGGATGLSANKLAQLAKLVSGATVFVCFDNDDAGANGTARAIEKLSSYGIQTKAVQITDLNPNAPQGFDLSDWLELKLTAKNGHNKAVARLKTKSGTNDSLEKENALYGLVEAKKNLENDFAFDWILSGVSPEENSEWLAALGIEKAGENGR